MYTRFNLASVSSILWFLWFWRKIFLTSELDHRQFTKVTPAVDAFTTLFVLTILIQVIIGWEDNPRHLQKLGSSCFGMHFCEPGHESLLHAETSSLVLAIPSSLLPPSLQWWVASTQGKATQLQLAPHLWTPRCLQTDQMHMVYCLLQGSHPHWFQTTQ